MVWLIVIPGLLWSLLRLAGWDRGPLVQLFAFTPYVAVWSWVAVIACGFAGAWIAGGFALVAALILSALVLPRALPSSRTSAGVELRVMTSNMLNGGATPGDIVRLVRDHEIDVLAVQEFTPDALVGLAAAGLDDLLPYTSNAAEPRWTGSGLYSRFPLDKPDAVRNPGGFMQASGIVTPPGAVPVRVESAHPNAPFSPAAKPLGDWRDDLRAQHVPSPDGPVAILMGDFNATLDHAEFRALIARGYVDAAEVAGKGLLATWGCYHGRRPLPPVTLDHVLADRRIGVRDVQVHRVGNTDHRAVLAWLSLPAL